MTKTRRTYNLMLFCVSIKSKGACLGTNNKAWTSRWPSTLKCFTDRWRSLSSDNDLWKDANSSFVTSSGSLIQMGNSCGVFILFKFSSSILLSFYLTPLAHGRTSAQQEKPTPKLERQTGKKQMAQRSSAEADAPKSTQLKADNTVVVPLCACATADSAPPARRCAVLLRNPPDKSPSGICPQVPRT